MQQYTFSAGVGSPVRYTVKTPGSPDQVALGMVATTVTMGIMGLAFVLLVPYCAKPTCTITVSRETVTPNTCNSGGKRIVFITAESGTLRTDGIVNLHHRMPEMSIVSGPQTLRV